jgi:hypothetical protein
MGCNFPRLGIAGRPVLTVCWYLALAGEYRIQPCQFNPASTVALQQAVQLLGGSLKPNFLRPAYIK